ncbi:MAG: nucleotide pyrophosphohydrolase [Anaerolineales bacterium]
MDSTTTISRLRTKVAQFIAARNWERYHTPKNLATSIAIEVAELQEHFQWLTTEESQEYLRDSANHAAVADELADVLIYCLSFADAAEIDVSEAVLRKMDRNEKRFPIRSG